MHLGFIDYIFAACCAIMVGMADLFGRTYEYVNVVMFCFVEPILSALMILGSAYVLSKLPKYRIVGKVTAWIALVVGVVTAILFIISGIHVFSMVDIHNLTYTSITSEISHVMVADSNQMVHGLFLKTMNWLLDMSRDNIGYNAFNLLVYVLAMPAIIIASAIVYFVRSRNKGNMLPTS